MTVGAAADAKPYRPLNFDGDAGNGFELALATLHTLDKITVGQDVIIAS